MHVIELVLDGCEAGVVRKATIWKLNFKVSSKSAKSEARSTLQVCTRVTPALFAVHVPGGASLDRSATDDDIGRCRVDALATAALGLHRWPTIVMCTVLFVTDFAPVLRRFWRI